ncbi:rRNA 2-O-methyltransferase fibrillarin [Archaeoglobus sulfaticallidus PM70-1]|uniref:Fibrillarin-like rRNA/tRNA 2'-O-methyltransferase n=1 Tax=Archaeoglobus sulfaticallidus PM70-1 TaxID=387631 RepID=N0BB85_9EURY|nr:fibrillarin-like rRNA/tRNA 2'-O-methyltransferase [Archaeoglobus sulfaticallidus]AGK60268.1 rRNA 2-O-methyltransferase fibrillarin [Archaeoglobus sulfaticallidus PM70-1]
MSLKGIKIIEKIANKTYLAEINGKETIVTESRNPPHYGEKKIGKYREWIPYRSKLSAMFMKGHRIDIKPEWKVLYLGAASGTTVSHISDILDYGYIYAIEYSAKPFKKFLELAIERQNIIPILDDAGKPENYSGIVEKVDFIYQDIAQKNQIEIFTANVDFFLKDGGHGLIMVKARSIDSTAEPESVFERVIDELKEKFRIVKSGGLEPYHKDHIFIHLKV